MSAKREPVVRIGVARDEIEASIWRDALEQEGVAVLVRRVDALASVGAPPFPSSLEVLVAARDEKRARWILGDLLNGQAGLAGSA